MQSGLFQQKVNEKVDNYLSTLDQKNYSQANKSSQETEAMGNAKSLYSW